MENFEQLMEEYRMWRVSKKYDSIRTGIPFDWDCGEDSAREDFSNFAELPSTICYLDMLELESQYNYNFV